MLTDAGLERILARIPSLTVGVLGDLFLDRYLDLDAGVGQHGPLATGRAQPGVPRGAGAAR